MAWFHRILDTFISTPASWLIRTKVVPANISEDLGIDPNKPVVYLLKNHSITDQIALKNAAKASGLPDPTQKLVIHGQQFDRCLSLETTPGIIKQRAKNPEIECIFTQLFEMHTEYQDLDIQIVPAYSFWGRSPGKKHAGWRDLIADKASPNWLRKFFIVLFLGRDNMLYLSRAVSSRYMVDQRIPSADAAYKLVRVAQTHFHRRRQTVTGPRQMAREQIIASVLNSNRVKQALQEAKTVKGKTPLQQAKSYADEIAGDYREGLIRIVDRLLTKLWNKVYNGIDINHVQKVRELADAGHEIVYVPCHRSHMDYLLLTYSIFHQGLMVPHIAAGINLNFWPAGPIFRRAGAFFIRRSFAGNKLYTAVFREYLEQLFQRGYPVKYYSEGGRSRTGRLLPPKTGMLAMTVQSLFAGIRRPITLVPVYIGYEHVMEVSSYLKELQGKEKKKENFLQVFSAIRKLKNYGHGYLNFGEPINLGQFMDSQQPGWLKEAQSQPDKKPTWLTPVTNKLATEVMQRVNQSAALNGMVLCSMTLLSSDRLSMPERELHLCLDLFVQLMQQAPYSQQMTLPDKSAAQLLGETLQLGKFQIDVDEFGQIISLDEKSAIAMTYYRNNILHVFLIPGLISAMIMSSNGMPKAAVVERIRSLFPMLKRELFLYQDQTEAEQLVLNTIAAMKQLGMLIQRGKNLAAPENDAPAFLPLWILGRNVQDTLQRYAIVLNVIEDNAGLSRNELEKSSIKLAERLTSVHGINAPEFYDKGVIATLVSSLRDNQLIETGADGGLKASEQGQWLLGELLHWLHPQVAQSIKQSRSA